jgi:hypothetical protein
LVNYYFKKSTYIFFFSLPAKLNSGNSTLILIDTENPQTQFEIYSITFDDFQKLNLNNINLNDGYFFTPEMINKLLLINSEIEIKKIILKPGDISVIPVNWLFWGYSKVNFYKKFNFI